MLPFVLIPSFLNNYNRMFSCADLAATQIRLRNQRALCMIMTDKYDASKTTQNKVGQLTM